MTGRVLIAGAGPTGLTAALELCRHGLTPVIIDKRPGPSPLSRAVGISRRSMEILTPGGVAGRIDAEAVHFGGIVFHDGPRELARLPLNFDDQARLWGLPQDRTETHLSDALKTFGVEVRYDTAFDALEQDRETVVAQTSAGEMRADWLIGADGAHSTVRDALGLGFPGYDLPGTWSIADVDAEGWRDPDHFKGYLLDGGHVVVAVPLETGRFRVISSLPDALAALPVEMNVTRLRRSGTFTIPVRQVTSYMVGRVCLAGDAAHCHSPVGGRGMNLGIADAADLAARIATGDVSGYHAARHAEGARIIRTTETARRMVQSTTPLSRAAVRTALRAADRVPPLGRAMIRRFVGR